MYAEIPCDPASSEGGFRPAAGCCRRLIGLVLAAGIWIGAARADTTEGWLYLGRRSADAWAPASLSVARPGYPVKAGDRVVVERDALVYGSVDCKVTGIADFRPEGAPRPVLRIKADREALEIVGSPIECPSAGRAKTVWANVRIPAARLFSAEK